MNRLLGMLLVGTFVLTACSVRVADERDGAPRQADIPTDPDSLPEVVPQNEPLSRYGNPEYYEVFGVTYYTMDSAEGHVEEGIASWYGTKFHGRRTSSGEPYNMYALTAAHKKLPLPTYVRVTNLENGRELVVKVNDRGPFHEDRVIDLSWAAAHRLDFADAGTARVRVEALEGGTPIANPEGTGDSPGVTAEGGPIYIQLGAFAELANAQEKRARAAGADIRSAHVERGRDTNGQRIYRVRVGPLDSVEEQRSVMERLEQAGIRVGQ